MNKQHIILTQNKKEARYRIILISIFCLIAICQSGLRDLRNLPMGNDTPVFQMKYNDLLMIPWDLVLKKFTFVSAEYSGRDSGYEVFMKLTQLFSEDFTFFMFLTATIFIVPFGMLIYRYVKSYLGIILAFLVYFSLFTNIVNSFMRQAVALGIVLFSIRYVLNRDWKKYFLIITFVSTIHSSAIVAVPLYFLPRFCEGERWLRLAFFAVPVFLFFQQTIYFFLLAGTVYENYVSSEMVSPVNYMMLIGSIALLSLIYYKEVKDVKNYDILISGVIGSILIFPVLFMGNTMLRISYYYVVFMIPLLPVIIDHLEISYKTRMIFYILAISFFSYFILRQ